MEDEIGPQAGGRREWSGGLGRNGPGRIALIARDPMVSHVRRVADDGGIGTAGRSPDDVPRKSALMQWSSTSILLSRAVSAQVGSMSTPYTRAPELDGSCSESTRAAASRNAQPP